MSILWGLSLPTFTIVHPGALGQAMEAVAKKAALEVLGEAPPGRGTRLASGRASSMAVTVLGVS